MPTTVKLPKNPKGASTPASARNSQRPVATRGIVNSILRSKSSKDSRTRKGAVSSSELVHALKDGLPVSDLDDLQNGLQIPMEKLTELLGISKSTLHRRRQSNERLTMHESDRVIRFARLLSLAVHVLESEEYARRWLSRAQTGLNGEVPLTFARTEVGAREVENLLGRIEYSVYS